METLISYFEALERLRSGRPRVVEKGTSISKDAVSLEAGRRKGSIKKSRPQFQALISEIEAAALEQRRPAKNQRDVVRKAKDSAKILRHELDAALARENSLLIELYDVRVQLSKLSGDRVFPIRRTSPNGK